jgi:tRNA(Ile)-lysidine synthase
LIPLLVAEYQPALREVIGRFMAVSGAEAELASAMARDWLERMGTSKGQPGPPGGGWGADYAGLPLAVRRQVLLRQLRERRIAADFTLVDRLLEFAGTKVTIAPGRRVWRDESGRVSEEEVTDSGFRAGRCFLEMGSSSGAGEFHGLRFRWERFERPAGELRIPRGQAGEEWFDADQLGERVVLRHWQAGDRYQPIGLSAPAKLQDLFVNAKIPRRERPGRIVAETARGGVFWVEGLRIGEVAMVRPDTRQMVRWMTERSPD